MRLNLVTWKRLWAVIAVLAVTLALLVVPNARAQEDEDEDVIDATPLTPAKYVDFEEVNVTVNHFDPVVDENTLEIRQWEFATFELKWAAPEGVIEGQTFTVKYPEQFRLYGNENFELKGNGGIVGGKCAVDSAAQEVTCTFDKTFQDKDNVRGTLITQVQAFEQTDQDKLSMEIDGVTKTVDLPGTEGIIGPLDRVGGNTFKTGWFDPNYITSGWRIDIPGIKLEQFGSETITITDTFDSTFKFDQTKTPILQAYDVSGMADTEGNPPSNIENIDESRKIGEDKPVDNFTLSNDGRTATFEISPPNPSGKWEWNIHYRIRYQAETIDGKPAPMDLEITNDANVNGVDRVSHTLKRTQNSSGTIEGVDRGSYQVRKVLSDSAFDSLVPVDAVFGVQADIVMPDGTEKTEHIEVSLNGEHAGMQELPEGSTVTLSEIEMPVIDGIEFGAPKFAADPETDPGTVEVLQDGGKIKFTTVAAHNIKILLTNTVKSGPGKFAVVKKTAGVTAARDKEFKFQYVCKVHGEEKTGEIVAKGNGEAVVVDETFPTGTICEITEDEKAAVIDGYDLVADPSDFKQTVTIGEEIAKAEFTNTYTRSNGGLAITKVVNDPTIARFSEDEEFKFEASWKQNGTTETREFTLRPDDVFDDFPELPVGTKVTVKEILPEDTNWDTPIFKGSVGGAVDDNGDGSATITVLADGAGLLVTVINSTDRGLAVPPRGSGALGLLALLGLAPLLGGLASSQSGGNGSASNQPGGGAPSAPEGQAPAQNANPSPNGVGGGQPGAGGGQPENNANTKNNASTAPQLARTGASVLGLIALALIVVAIGAFLVRRARRSEQQ